MAKSYKKMNGHLEVSEPITKSQLISRNDAERSRDSLLVEVAYWDSVLAEMDKLGIVLLEELG